MIHKEQILFIFQKMEWFYKIIGTETWSSEPRQKVKVGDILIHRETSGVLCSICSEADALSEFTSGKKWNEWKLEYLSGILIKKYMWVLLLS
jgi:hypothetical protein